MSVRSLRYNSLMLGQAKYSAASTDRDAAAFLEVAGIYVSHQQKAIYELVRLLKQYGLWSKMKAVYPFIGGTATTHKWNLKDPRDLDAAFRLVFNGGWTHSETGADPNGTNARANTFITPNTHLSYTNIHGSVYVREQRSGANTCIEFGAYTSSPNRLFAIYAEYRDNNFSNITSGDVGDFLTSRISVSNSDAKGYYSIRRSANNSLKLDRNGIVFGSNTITDNSGLSTKTINLSAVDVDGTYVQWSNRQIAFATFGDDLTDEEAANLYWAVDKYQRLLSRNV